MSSRHLVSEMVSSINVALRSNYLTAVASRSNFIVELANTLYVNGFIKGFTLNPDTVLFYLKYYNSKPVITSLKVISTPGKRQYWRLSKLNQQYNTRSFSGVYIVSTHKGLLTSNDCLLLNRLGGEIVLKIEV